MKAKARCFYVISVAAGWFAGFGGCATRTVTPAQAPAPDAAAAPAYLGLPFPSGYGVSDIRALFQDRDAPPLASLKGCDTGYRLLSAATRSRQELMAGMRELVARDPVFYHWCFYGKILELDDDLHADAYIDEKQKRVLAVYDFLVPLARTFMTQYQDSRYLRWAVRDYRRLSDWIFFRHLELTPEMSSELVDVGNPTAFGSPPVPTGEGSILEKYKIGGEGPSKNGAEVPPPDSARSPAGSPAAKDRPSGLATPAPTFTVTAPRPALPAPAQGEPKDFAPGPSPSPSPSPGQSPGLSSED